MIKMKINFHPKKMDLVLELIIIKLTMYIRLYECTRNNGIINNFLFDMTVLITALYINTDQGKTHISHTLYRSFDIIQMLHGHWCLPL